VLAGLLGGSILLATFLVVEGKVRSPMVPFSLFESRAFLGANVLTLLLYGALGIFFFLFPMGLIQGGGYSPTAAGSAMLPMILAMFFCPIGRAVWSNDTAEKSPSLSVQQSSQRVSSSLPS